MSLPLRARLLPAILALAFLMPASLGARDFGLLLNQRLWFGNASGSTDADYWAVLLPRFSALVGDYGDLFLSASLTAARENEEWNVVPELLRNEFSWRLGRTDLRAGRMVYADPMGLVAVGLFDGVHLSYHTMMGTFGIGLWYTGLLYSRRARISMTPEDAAAMNEEVDWGDFFNTYFASRRMVTALHWEHPSFEELLRLSAALIIQTDLNGRSSAYNSQYLITNASMPFRQFIFEFGSAIELAQSPGGDDANFQTAFAADVGLHWMPPTPFHSMLSFTGRFTSGKAGSGSRSAFTPITSLLHGSILRAEIPGLSVLSLGYTARLRRDFSAGLALSHFVLSDAYTYRAYPLNGQRGSGYFLGTEFFGHLIWSPVSDISLNFGAGAFLPSLGNVAPRTDPLWRVIMAATLALR